MLTLIIVLVLVAAVTFVLMRKGKIADANNNNIPDAIESKIEAVKEVVEEVKEVVKEAKAKTPKAPKQQPIAKTKATKKTK
jgi:predicted GTPase